MSEERKVVYDAPLDWLNKELPFDVFVINNDHTVQAVTFVSSHVGGPLDEQGEYTARWFVDVNDEPHLPDFDELFETREGAIAVAIDDIAGRIDKIRVGLQMLVERRAALEKQLHEK